MAKKRGFASMDPAKQREIASKGGKAAHQKGTAHKFTSEEARAAGRKGGRSVRAPGPEAPEAPQINPAPPPLPNGNASPEQTTGQASVTMPSY